MLGGASPSNTKLGSQKEIPQIFSTEVIHWIILLCMHTVVELPEYLRRAERLLLERERQELVNYLAERPKAGVIMRGTGGIRKLRWARAGMGKRGGVRVIYYYHNEQMPLYLVTLFGKGVKDNLTPSERHALRDLVRILIETWRMPHESSL